MGMSIKQATTDTIYLNTWTARDGSTRRYINNWHTLAGLELGRYNTGNIRWACLNDEKISNTQANRILNQTRVWIDDQDGVHVDRPHALIDVAALTEAVTEWFQTNG